MTLAWEIVGSSVRFAFEVGENYQWAALGFQKGKMSGDAIVIEANTINPYRVSYQQTPTLITTPYYTNASIVKVNGLIRGSFTRTIAAPSPTAVPIGTNGMNFMTACSATGAFPTVHSVSERASDEYVNLVSTPAPTVLVNTTSAPTRAPTPKPAVVSALTGYNTYMNVLDSSMRIAWTVNDTHVKFGFESNYAAWVGLGVQSPTASTKMTGQAVIAQSASSTIAAYSLEYAAAPSAFSGAYMTEAVAGLTTNMLHGEFVRTLAAPSAGAVAISDVRNVRLMVAFSDSSFPALHSKRAEIVVDLLATTAPTSSMPQTAGGGTLVPALSSFLLLSLLLLRF